MRSKVLAKREGERKEKRQATAHIVPNKIWQEKNGTLCP
jgi:hypothetical protein